MLPYDPWFDSNYKYDPDKKEFMDDYGRPPNPLDSMPIATDKAEKKDASAELSLHEKAYRLARSKYNPFSVGGSENIHDFDRKD